MKKLILSILFVIIMAGVIVTPARAADYGYAGQVQITCDNWTRSYTVTVSKLSADLQAWNSYRIPYGCITTGVSLSDGYRMDMILDNPYGVYWTTIYILR